MTQAALPTDFCRGCGCTEEHACPGGCFWVQPGVCSACVLDAGDQFMVCQLVFGHEAAMAALRAFKARLGAACLAGQGPAPWPAIEAELAASERALKKHAAALAAVTGGIS